jgi:hypothetical protein
MTEGQVFDKADIQVLFHTFDISVMPEPETVMFLLNRITVRYITDTPLDFNIYYKGMNSNEIVYTIPLPIGDKETMKPLPLFMMAREYHYEITGSQVGMFQLIEADLKHFLVPIGMS